MVARCRDWNRSTGMRVGGGAEGGRAGAAATEEEGRAGAGGGGQKRSMTRALEATQVVRE